MTFFRRLDQPRQFLLQSLQDLGHAVDRLLHLLVVALVGLRDQFVDLAVRDLGQNAIALADGQKNCVEHGVDTADNLRVRAVELLRLAAFGELPLFGRLGQPPHFFFQGLNNYGNVIDGNLHLLVVALIGLRDQLVNLAVRNLRENPVALSDGQENRVQHLVDALNHLAMNAVEDGCLAAFREPSFFGRVHQAHDLLQDEHRVVLGQRRLGIRSLVCLVSDSAISIAVAMKLPAFPYQCCSRHELRSSLCWNPSSTNRSSARRENLGTEGVRNSAC